MYSDLALSDIEILLAIPIQNQKEKKEKYK
jgi:hypothetical protein